MDEALPTMAELVHEALLDLLSGMEATPPKLRLLAKDAAVEEVRAGLRSRGLLPADPSRSTPSVHPPTTHKTSGFHGKKS